MAEVTEASVLAAMALEGGIDRWCRPGDVAKRLGHSRIVKKGRCHSMAPTRQGLVHVVMPTLQALLAKGVVETRPGVCGLLWRAKEVAGG